MPVDPVACLAEARRRRAALATLLGGLSDGTRISPQVEAQDGARIVRFEPEPGVRLAARVEPRMETDARRAVLLDLGGGEVASASPMAAELRRAGWSIVTLDLRATGRLAVPSDHVGHAPDHNSAEWGLWIGRPLLGQWVVDVRRLLDALDAAGGNRPRETTLVGIGPGGLVALTAAAVDPRVAKVVAVGSLASFVSDEPYRGQRLGVMVPGLLREVGDVAHLAALIAPRRVVIAGGVSGGGRRIHAGRLREIYSPATRTFGSVGAGDAIRILEAVGPAGVVEAMR
jgi:hypothetical protein